MAQQDWKRYYAVVYDRPYKGPKVGQIYSRRGMAYGIALYELDNPSIHAPGRPIGVVSIRGRKNNPALQKTLLDMSI